MKRSRRNYYCQVQQAFRTGCQNGLTSIKKNCPSNNCVKCMSKNLRNWTIVWYFHIHFSCQSALVTVWETDTVWNSLVVKYWQWLALFWRTIWDVDYCLYPWLVDCCVLLYLILVAIHFKVCFQYGYFVVVSPSLTAIEHILSSGIIYIMVNGKHQYYWM